MGGVLYLLDIFQLCFEHLHVHTRFCFLAFEGSIRALELSLRVPTNEVFAMDRMLR